MSINTVYNNNIDSRTSGYIPVWGQEKPSGERNSPSINGPSEQENFDKLVKNYDDRTAGMSRMNENSPNDWSFWDFLDVINPLQHIPIISTAYRAITGDEIKPAARAMGSVIYGGPLGIVGAAIEGSVADATGKGVTENLVAMAFKGDKSPNNPKPYENETETMLAKIDNGDSTVIAAANLKAMEITNQTSENSEEKEDNLNRDFIPVMEDVDIKDNYNYIRNKKLPSLLPPELLAQEMLSALDKYQEMKAGGG